jgi:CRISPR/Cas system-associated endonuclease Cas3-HD
MIKVIYDTTDNETIKKLAARGIVINELTTMLEKGIARYKIKYQVFPKSLSELERVNYVLIPVAVKDAFDVVISEDGGFKIVEKK